MDFELLLLDGENVGFRRDTRGLEFAERSVHVGGQVRHLTVVAKKSGRLQQGERRFPAESHE